MSKVRNVVICDLLLVVIIAPHGKNSPQFALLQACNGKFYLESQN